MAPKFRAWIKKEERMAQVMSLHFIERGDLTGVNTYPEMGCLSIHFISDVVLMQSTGLKDDNGVEIYEGDLLSLDGSKPYPVYWDDGAFQVGEVSDLSYVNGYCASLVVVGNIYENPELLEEEGEYHAEPEGMDDYTSDHEEEDDSEITGRDWKPDRDEQNFKEGLDSYLTRSDWD